MPTNPYEPPKEMGTKAHGIPPEAARLFLLSGALAIVAAIVFVGAWFLVYAIQELHWPLGDAIGVLVYFNSVLPFGPALLSIGALATFVVGWLKRFRP